MCLLLLPFFCWQVVDIQPKEVNTTIAEAQAIWTRFYGKIRSSGSDNRPRRRDLGVPRQKLSQFKPSLTTWLEQRKLEVSEAQDKLVPGVRDSPLLPIWTESHDKELKFVGESQAHIFRNVSLRFISCFGF